MEAIYKTTAPSLIQQPVPTRSAAEFFAGIGLMRLGLERAGWHIAFANDISEEKYAMYAGHFSDAKKHFVVGDIHALSVSAVPSVALATASFPCTDLSLAGMRQGLSGKESSAYWGFVKILEDMGDRRPPLVLLENVAGFLTSRGGHDFHEALLALNRLGYAVDAVIIDAIRFVPQSRVRLFVIGIQATCYGRQWKMRETPLFYESVLRPRALAEFILSHPDILWNIRELPDPPQSTQRLEDLVEDVSADSSLWWSEERSRYLCSQMSKKHTDALGKLSRRKDWSYATVFRRVRNGVTMAELRCDGIAGCLRTPRGGSARQIIIKAGYNQVFVRLLTPLECARLMGADEFTISASLNQALFGFGDAVCVPVVAWLAQVYLNPLFDRYNQVIEQCETDLSLKVVYK